MTHIEHYKENLTGRILIKENPTQPRGSKYYYIITNIDWDKRNNSSLLFEMYDLTEKEKYHMRFAPYECEILLAKNPIRIMQNSDIIIKCIA